MEMPLGFKDILRGVENIEEEQSDGEQKRVDAIEFS